MTVDCSSDVEARFLRGAVGFETALSEIVGAEITRADLVLVLHTVAEVAAAASRMMLFYRCTTRHCSTKRVYR